MSSKLSWAHRTLASSIAVALIVPTIVVMQGCAETNETAGDSNAEGTSANSGSDLWMTDYKLALKKAEESDRPVLTWFTGSDWCVWCTRLDEEVFQQKEFQTWARENVICVVLDYPRGVPQSDAIVAQNERLMEKFGGDVGGYPTVLVLDHEEKVVGKLGYAEGGPENWISLAEQEIGKGS